MEPMSLDLLVVDTNNLMESSAEHSEHLTVRIVVALAAGLSFVWLVCSLVAYSNAGGPNVTAWLAVWFFGFLLAILSAGAFVIVLATGHLSARRWEWLGLAAAPVALAAWMWAHSNDIPLRVRIALAEDDLMRVVAAAENSDPGTQFTTDAGTFNVHGVRQLHGCSFITTQRGWFFWTAGLARCKNGLRPEPFASGVVLHHVTGPWWTWGATD